MNYSFVIDNRLCIGCHACTVACKRAQYSIAVNRTHVKYIEGRIPIPSENFPFTDVIIVPMLRALKFVQQLYFMIELMVSLILTMTDVAVNHVQACHMMPFILTQILYQSVIIVLIKLMVIMNLLV